MEYGLIGERLGHSYSPMIHARLADYRYYNMDAAILRALELSRELLAR